MTESTTNESRIRNSKRNIVSGVIKQTLGILLPFLIRTLLIYTIGAEYQGLSGLFTSILQVLNLTDLGFSVAVTYIMYKPAAEHDTETLCALTAYLRKVYRYVGAAILALGLLISPFLPHLISKDLPADVNLYVIFYVYLFNTAVSYFLFAYKSTVLNAMQRADVVNNLYSLTSCAVKILQIVLLATVKNYYAFVFVMPLGTVANSICVALASKKHFPEIMPKGKVTPEQKAMLAKQIKAIFIGKVSDIARNSFDNIVISTLFGLVAVTVYDNYYYIYSAVYGMMLAVTSAIQASVGNSLAKETKEKNYRDFLKFSFLFAWITGWFSSCMFSLYQPFMFIWMKGDESLLLPFFEMTLFVVYFYAINANNTKNLYLEGYGLYHEARVWFMVEAAANLILNFALGYFFGICGILLATIITIIAFNFFARTGLLFKHYFERSPKEFYIKQFCYLLATAAACAATYGVCALITLSGIPGLLIKGLVCCVVPNAVLFVCYFRTEAFREAFAFVKKVLKRN